MPSPAPQPTKAVSTTIWSDHPARQRPTVATGVVAVIVVFGVLTTILMGHWGWGIGAVIVMVVALNRFFFPSRWEIDSERILAHYPLRKQSLQWDVVRRFVVDAYGGFLSTRARRSRLDPYRGMHLRFPDDRRQAIIAQIRAALPSSGPSVISEGGVAPCSG